MSQSVGGSEFPFSYNLITFLIAPSLWTSSTLVLSRTFVAMPMSRESSKSSGSPPSPEGDVQYKEKASIDGAEDAASNEALGYKQELTRNRSLFTLLFQSLAIAAIPYGEGSPLINAVYGGGQLSIFVGWIICNLLSECTACSLAELASRYPTAGGPSYWAHKISPRGKDLAAYMTGWVYLIGNWTITLRYVPISTSLPGLHGLTRSVSTSVSPAYCPEPSPCTTRTSS